MAPGCEYSEGTGFEGHEYFEAASIRKKDDLYLLIYSSVVMHELCYAYSKSPLEGFQYGGVLNSNVDLGIDTYKPADRPAAFGANQSRKYRGNERGLVIFFITDIPTVPGSPGRDVQKNCLFVKMDCLGRQSLPPAA